MLFKIIAAFAFVAIASAGYLSGHHEEGYEKSDSYDSHPKYNFDYAVNDKHTGDVKSHSESRDGDVVHGEYSLLDSDGHKRTVHYTADHDHGFNAVVHREPVGHASSHYHH